MKVANYIGDVRTRLSWLSQGRVPLDGHPGEEMWTNGFCGQTAIYWHFDETREATPSELAALRDEERRRKNALARAAYHRRKDREREEKEWEEAQLQRRRDLHTAWQWLRYHHRVPKPGARPVREDWGWEGHAWWYYWRDDTEPATYTRYAALKDRYIKLFGGWESIDLDSTRYDGRTWWEGHYASEKDIDTATTGGLP